MRGRRSLFALGLMLAARSALAFEWGLADSPGGCEPPEVFYSAAHDPAVTAPCCPQTPERCPAGVACSGGFCAAPYGSIPCTAPSGADVPNIIVVLNDDQGWCHYGFMGPGCGTSTTGMLVPVPETPNIDRLALQPANDGKGRLFEISYSNAAWSLPARETLQMGLVRKDVDDSFVAERYIPEQLAQPGGPVFCSFGAGGKLGGSKSESLLGFAAWNSGRKWGRYNCAPAPCFPNCDDPPLCGPDLPDETPDNVQDVFDFVASTLLGPRDGSGNLLPATTYTQAQPFMVWISSSLPHGKHKPPVAIEDRYHFIEDYLFGQSFANPGQPRFPFADPAYALAWNLGLERDFAGLYGMIWWGDDGIRHLRNFFESVQVWDHTGTTATSLWERSVVVFTTDNGADLPRAKRNFTENGYRSPLVIYDSRLPSAPGETRVEQELTHAIDLLPTLLDFAGKTIPPTPGHSLKPYLDAVPPAAPIRNTLCGHETKGTKPKANRYLRTRPGSVGRCSVTTTTQCLEDADCPGGETCGDKSQKWCRFGRHPVDETGIPTVDQQPVVPCTTDADCVAGCPSSDPLYCTCEWRALKLYSLADGTRRLMDLFVDPNEPGMDRKLRKQGPQPGDLPVGGGDPHGPIASRLACCTDRWWTPPPLTDGTVLGNPSCGSCGAAYACHRCGDGIVDSVEQCDSANLNGNTCTSVPGGFSGGALACSASCTFDTGACTP
jgi:hypothetical protein